MDSLSEGETNGGNKGDGDYAKEATLLGSFDSQTASWAVDYVASVNNDVKSSRIMSELGKVFKAYKNTSP